MLYEVKIVLPSPQKIACHHVGMVGNYKVNNGMASSGMTFIASFMKINQKVQSS